MGLITSRLNFENLQADRRGSQHDETFYSYASNKNCFSNYFVMGGERFEVKDPDYLFGDNCDLNFLSCTKPNSFPYKQAQKDLLASLNTKQRVTSKVSSRVQTLGSQINILAGRGRTHSSRKQDAQTQTLHDSKGTSKGIESSRPLVLFVNIRKETLRLVKASTVCTTDRDSNSLKSSNSVHVIEQIIPSVSRSAVEHSTLKCLDSSASHLQPQTKNASRQLVSMSTDRRPKNLFPYHNENEVYINDTTATSDSSTRNVEPDVGSLLSAISSSRSGYTSMKEDANRTDSDEEEFKDALNDTANLSILDEDDDDNSSEKTQQKSSLLRESKQITLDTRDAKTAIGTRDNIDVSNFSDIKPIIADGSCDGDENLIKYSTPRSERRAVNSSSKGSDSLLKATKTAQESSASRAYNIEFNFDAEVDCSIRIFYFCTREITSNGITYKPKHPTYRSKVYHYKKGINQKFEQQDHTFQPYLFDEDLLIYKPLDADGNYNSGAVFPIVIHCAALEGQTPRQSHSLVATIERSQLDDSYSIKPLKQLIFADGVHYILQDIYGIENKQLAANPSHRLSNTKDGSDADSRIKNKSNSLQSNLNRSNLNLSDSVSIASLTSVTCLSRQLRASHGSNHYKSSTGENAFECVICMSEERDTMLLPCRHLCLCSSCAQSLRYQASSCPICRCPFRAALNFRPVPQRSRPSASSAKTKPLVSASTPAMSASPTRAKHDNQNLSTEKGDNVSRKTHQSRPNDECVKFEDETRRESVTTSTTPLLSPPHDVYVNMDGICCENGGAASSLVPESSSGQSNCGVVVIVQSGSRSVCNSRAEDREVGSMYENGSLEMRPLNVSWTKSPSSQLPP